MHRSRVGQILIDCHEDTWGEAVSFWSQALGLDPAPPTEGGRYVRLGARGSGPEVVLQRVEDESAYHLDIETDDVEAEVARLEALGAARSRKGRDWWVMRAPTGHPFCVIAPETPGFPNRAASWED